MVPSRSYELLAAFGDPLGDSYRRNHEVLKRILQIRNMSLLAHGFQPVSADTYAMLLQIALDFSSLERKGLPCFPGMDWGSGL